MTDREKAERIVAEIINGIHSDPSHYIDLVARALAEERTVSEEMVERSAKAIWGSLAQLDAYRSEVPWDQVLSRPRHQGLKELLFYAGWQSLTAALGKKDEGRLVPHRGSGPANQ